MSAMRAPTGGVTLARTADGRPILDRATLDAYDGRPRRSGGEHRYYCPVHGGDHQQSLAVNLDTGLYHCHSCHASGTLRDYWPAPAGGQDTRRAPVPVSLAERGRAALDWHAHAEADKHAKLAGAVPAAAAAFIARLDVFTNDLRRAGSPGTTYLSSRGLDPELAARLGAGYAPPKAWPGDTIRPAGRIVYPLADALTGRIVSAAGRLTVDASPTWPEKQRKDFKGLKQRKLADCAAGVWPYASIAAAREHHRPLVLVEGPADALALMQHADGAGLDALALMGTAGVLPLAALDGLPGVVLALDPDGAGRRAVDELRTRLALAGVRTATVAADWLGDAKDAGELPTGDDAGRYAAAVAAVHAACHRLTAPAWNAAAADKALREMLDACAVAYVAHGFAALPEGDDELNDAIDAARERRDWPAFVRAVDDYRELYGAVEQAPVEQAQASFADLAPERSSGRDLDAARAKGWV